MSVKRVVREIEKQCAEIRSGLDIGFAEPLFSERLRALRGGVWRTVELTPAAEDAARAMLPGGTVLRMMEGAALPFEDRQFEVVVVNGSIVGDDLIKEVHRVLLPQGFLFFSVNESSSPGQGYTEKGIFRLLRHGFDLVTIERPSWWRFWLPGGQLTICARKKAWLVHRGFIYPWQAPFTTMGDRK